MKANSIVLFGSKKFPTVENNYMIKKVRVDRLLGNYGSGEISRTIFKIRNENIDFIYEMMR